MSPAVERFLQLHRTAFVERWQWLFGESMLRATTDDGRTATISGSELRDLIAAGEVQMIGCSGVKLCRS